MAELSEEIEMIRGDTRVIELTFYESDATTPINLTGGKVFFTVNVSKEPTSDAAAVVEKDSTTFVDAANGRCDITLDASDTTNVATGKYYYDAQFVSSSGVVISHPRGRFILNGDITRRVV